MCLNWHRVLLGLIAPLAFGLALLAMTVASRQLVRDAPPKMDGAIPIPPLVGFSPRTIQLITLGHTRLYDHVLTLWATQTLGEPKAWMHDAANVRRLADRLLTHRPRSETFYLTTCIYYYQVLKMPELCEAVTNVGLQAVPDSYWIPAVQGHVFQFFLKDLAKAAQYFALAASKPKCPKFYGQAAAKLAAQSQADGGTEVDPLDRQKSLDMMHQLEQEFGNPEATEGSHGDREQSL